MNQRLQLGLYLGLAVGLAWVPGVHVPLKWFETLFHESSHALAAVLTGGHVARLSLAWNGSGLTWSSGGFRPLVSFAGYAGAIGWGTLLYRMATSMAPRTVRYLIGTLAVAACLEVVFWLAWDGISELIMGTLLLLLGLLWHPRAARWAKPALRLIGAYVLMSALVSPTYILQTGQTGDNDAKALAHMLWVPSVVWVGIWLALGLLAIVSLYRTAARLDRQRGSTGA